MAFDVDEPPPTPIAPLDPIVWVEPDTRDDRDTGRAMPPPVPDHPDRRDDPAWEAYHQAFTALEDGNRDLARRFARDLARRSPTHPATAALARVADLLETGPAQTDTATPDVPRAERKSSNARAELALVQSAHGAAIGVELCSLGNCEQTEELALALLGGAGGAIGTLSLVDNLKPGVATAIDSGTVWGFVEGVLLSATINSDISGPALLMQGVGTLAGGLVVAAYHPRAGAVAAMNSGGLWALVLGLCATQVLSTSPDAATIGVAGILTLNVGLAVGATIGYEVPTLDRGDTLIYDVGGLTGMLVGMALSRGLVSSHDDQSDFAGAGIGAVAGLAITAGLVHTLSSRHHRSSAPAVDSFVMPAPDHARGGIASVGWRF